MLRDYVDWWGQQLVELVPETVRRAAEPDSDAILLIPNGEPGRAASFDLQIMHAGRIGSLGHFALDQQGLASAAQAAGSARSAPVRLRLPAGTALEKNVALPLAAERDIERVLGYEMDRETPFAASEVWWTYDILARDKGRERLDIRLSLVPRAAIADLLVVLRRGGLEPAVLDIDRSGGGRRLIPLKDGARLPGLRAPRAIRYAGLACIVLAVLAVGFPFVRQSVALARANRVISDLKDQVAEAEALRQRLNGGEGGEALVAERLRLGDPLAVLATATSLLPDDTYLTDFTMQQRRITMNGQSVNAAKLISLLANNPTFKDPAFAAPITRIEGARTEGFAIGAEARP